MLKSKKINHRLIIKIELLVLAVCAVIGALQFIKIPPSTKKAIKEAIALATTRKPETFTELYFEDHINLPKDTVLRKLNKFKFTVHNLEFKEMTYPYEVYIEFNGQKQMIDKGSFSLKQDEYKTIEEVYALTRPTKRVKVVVNLTNKNQQIDFWLEDQK